MKFLKTSIHVWGFFCKNCLVLYTSFLNGVLMELLLICGLNVSVEFINSFFQLDVKEDGREFNAFIKGQVFNVLTLIYFDVQANDKRYWTLMEICLSLWVENGSKVFRWKMSFFSQSSR